MSRMTIQPATYGLDSSIPQFSLDRYQRMIEAGILDQDDRVELLENYVVRKMPRNPAHDNAVDRILDVLYPLKPAGWRLRVQSAITLADSQPEPDLAFVRGDLNQFEATHPGADEIGLLIEVADTSLKRDTVDKTRIYARAGVPVYWVVNLTDRRVEVFTQPSGATPAPGYLSMQTCSPGDMIPLLVDGQVVASVPVAQLFS
jgi:Uma2 family endonuclease